MEKEYINKLILDFLQNDIEDAELYKLEAWRKASKGNQQYFEEQKRIWEESSEVAVFLKFNPQSAYSNLSQRIGHFDKIGLRKKRWYATASVIAACVILFFGINYIHMSKLEAKDVVFMTEYGEKATVMLPDGSSVKLNSGSKLSYNMAFGRNNRMISLTGEAFFDVEKASLPFTVEALDKIKIEVFGTRFNVRAYPDIDHIETVLEEGSIALSSLHSNVESIVLDPGQKASYKKGNRSFELSSVKSKSYSGWTVGKLYFIDESLVDLAKKIEKTFNVEIKLDELQFRNEFHYTGVFENETIDEVLEALASTGKLDFIRKGKIIEIRKK